MQSDLQHISVSAVMQEANTAPAGMSLTSSRSCTMALRTEAGDRDAITTLSPALQQHAPQDDLLQILASHGCRVHDIGSSACFH